LIFFLFGTKQNFLLSKKDQNGAPWDANVMEIFTFCIFLTNDITAFNLRLVGCQVIG
jgi:hypothetical protein